MTDSNGAQIGATIKYLPFGECRNSQQELNNLPTDKKFTGQRLDGTGLYYYNARYYDPTIGRFISADIIVPDPTNPQAFNRYSYCLNNPLKLTDPSGHWPNWRKIFKVAAIVVGVALVTSVVLITAGAIAPAFVAAGVGVIGGGSLTAGEITTVSIAAGVVAGATYAANSSDSESSLPASKVKTNSGGQTGSADPNQGSNNKSTQGKKQAPKKSDSNSDYYQVDEKGNIISHTHYDESGYPDYRQDIKPGHGIDGAHRHDFLFDENGYKIDEDDPIPIEWPY